MRIYSKKEIRLNKTFLYYFLFFHNFFDARQELSYLEGFHQHIPRAHIRWMYGSIEEVGGMAVGACGVVSPAYGKAVRLEPGAVGRSGAGGGYFYRTIAVAASTSGGTSKNTLLCT